MTNRNQTSEIRTLIKLSRKRVKRYFDNDFKYHRLPVRRSSKFLRKHNSEQLPMFVLYVDLIGSTKMSYKLSVNVLSLIIRSFCQEMAYIIEHYEGRVLKFVGDAAIGYFIANDKSPLMAEKTVNCAKSMIPVIEEAINPVLKEKKIVKLKVKITVDFGIGSIILYSADKRRAHVDIISRELNFAAKMQNVAKPNQIVIGKHVYAKLNSRLKSSFKKVKTDVKKWDLETASKRPYPVYTSI